MLRLLTILAYSAPIVLTQTTESNDCSSFSTNGAASSNFQYYRFYDFRNITTSNTKRHVTQRDVEVSNRTVANSWMNDWYVRDFPRASPGGTSIPVNFIPERVNIVTTNDTSHPYTTYLSLTTSRLNDTNQESGEITYTEHNITAASIRVLCRVHGSPGGVAGIFTYQNDTQESDIELFTRSPDHFIQYSNQPASSGEPDWTPIPGATVNNTLPNEQTYSEWLVHRLDWVPGMERSVFFVNDEETNVTDLHVPAAEVPSAVYLDMWSANSSWSGSMEIGGEAALDVQWIELVFNASEPVDRGVGEVCEVGRIDEEAIEHSGAGRMVATGLLAGGVVLASALFV